MAEIVLGSIVRIALRIIVQDTEYIAYSANISCG